MNDVRQRVNDELEMLVSPVTVVIVRSGEYADSFEALGASQRRNG